MVEPIVFTFEHLETPLIPWQWPFAQQRRDEIAEHFQMLQRKDADAVEWARSADEFLFG